MRPPLLLTAVFVPEWRGVAAVWRGAVAGGAGECGWALGFCPAPTSPSRGAQSNPNGAGQPDFSGL